jgi:branched-subunit amino acid aminotransferase/4-amino-4-deoxychorismate lyase
MKIHINGALYAERDAMISVLDDSFLSGRGIRECFVCREGMFFHLDERLEHLKTFASELRMEFSWPIGDIKEALANVYDINKFDGKDALLTLILSAGSNACHCPCSNTKAGENVKLAEEAESAGETKVPAKPSKSECGAVAAPSLIITAKPLSQEEPADISLALLERFSLGDKILQWERYTLGKVGTFLARMEAKQKTASGAILTDANGIICGCTEGDLFAIAGNDIFTPALDRPWFLGKFLYPILPETDDMKVTEKQLRIQDLSAATECFLIRPCGKIVPVAKIGDITIGNGNERTVTKIISTCLPQKIRNECHPAF